MKKNIILMGPPAAGKGTIAVKLKTELGLVHISTGDMFREAKAEGTELGKLAASYMDKGDLVPDDVTIGIVKERLNKGDLEGGYLLDGFPRTPDQAVALTEITRGTAQEVDCVINLQCEESELLRRISGRRVCRQCGAPYNVYSMPPKVEGVCDECGGELYQRADDTEEALRVRLQHYDESTKPLLDYYGELGLVKNFDSSSGTDILFKEIVDFLKA